MTNQHLFSAALNKNAIAPRVPLVEQLDLAWQRLGAPGTWLTGEQKLAIARATRASWTCTGCDARKDALSPYAPAPDHDATEDLDDAWVQIVHFVTRDSGRMTKRAIDDALASSILVDELVELFDTAIMTQTMDSFALGIGLPQVDLPHVSPGAPDRIRRETVADGPGWVPTVAPEDASADFADFYADDFVFNIRRALTLIPREARRHWALARELYLEDPRYPELQGLDRSINRAQMEFLAARSSALLGCYY